ncbi:pseudouridine-5'-phosphate glycosidase [Thermomonospora umbrina]|uniref:Pseudouridine-5'-phosphate glycosidase n=2 Tax=Thermomonospora umbrina TaxID=111806 RepID=A0A3D9SP87_9ACTN|nr:pseudouridine-5'-phosphate glycosidase [Thermomonospora umbrina]
MDPLLEVIDEVATAIAERRPVVALESSLVVAAPSADVALDIEKSVRDAGAVPATIGIADGRLRVGMEPALIERLRSAASVPKVSARDIGPVLAGGGLGATTVAGTIVIAERAGIEVFATAGIGGVHRRAQETFDVSPDLLQFTRTRMVVVSGGCKSILDSRLTAEYLETAGVPVLGYGTDRLPAFYVRDTDLPIRRVDGLTEAARGVRAHWEVNGGGTVLLTTPVAEEDALDRDLVENAIERALAEADAAGVTGNAVSPFLMRAVSAATEGRTRRAGRSLLLSTARVAGEFAVALTAARDGG